MTDSDHIMQLRQQVANLHGLLVKALAQRDEAKSKLGRIMEGLEGTCMTCEPVGVRNQQMVQDIKTMQDQRDEARREVCIERAIEVAWDLGQSGPFATSPQTIAKSRGWDCFGETP
jgi:hypothetical protein